MRYNQTLADTPEHSEILGLIPWYVNGTLAESDRQRVDSHLSVSALCRKDLLQERLVYDGMSGKSGIEYMPAASLKRLQAKLDRLESETEPLSAQQAEHRFRRSFGRSFRQRGLLAASIVALAVALGLFATNRWLPRAARVAPAVYYTVTTPETRSPDEVIRAVFSPTITLVDLQSLLDEAQLRIISGPTEAGVYSLAAKSGRPVSESLALLRNHPAVRFAESTKVTRAEPAPP